MRLYELDDAALVALTLEGNHRAAAALLARHEKAIYSSVKYTLPEADSDTLDEVAQKTFIKTLRALPTFQFKSSFETWVKGIAKNFAFDFKKSLRRRVRHEMKYRAAHPEIVKPEAPFELEPWQVDAYRKAVASFPEGDRAIWKLRSEGASHEDIADALGLTVANVRVRTMRMKDKLVDMLMKYRTNKSKGISRHRAETIVKMLMARGR